MIVEFKCWKKEMLTGMIVEELTLIIHRLDFYIQ